MAKRGRPLGEFAAALAASPNVLGRSARLIAQKLAPDVNRKLAELGEEKRKSVGFSPQCRTARRGEGLEELLHRHARIRSEALKSHLSDASLAALLQRRDPQFAEVSLRTLRRDIGEIRKLATPASAKKAAA